MRSQLRNWDSKITFFAFADIITAVSGMLIFITLLLATGLGQQSPERAAISAMEKQLEETLAQQSAADAKNARAQEMLASAQTAPSATELQADVARLRSQLDDAARQHAAILDKLGGSQASADIRDKRLGLSGLRAEAQRARQETEAIALHENEALDVVKNLENQVLRLRAALLRLSERDGQLWLIPDKTGMSKEPILVTVGAKEAVAERFNHSGQKERWSASSAVSDLGNYLRKANATSQYVVFLIRPSGIGLFRDLATKAHGSGFEIGYDAIDEGQQIHFSTPPPVDEAASAPRGNSPTAASGQPEASARAASAAATPPSGRSASNESTKTSEAQPPAAKPPPPVAPPQKKSWWQRFLEWLGIA